MIVYIIAFSIGVGPIPWVSMAELLPNRARSKCGGIITSFNLLCAFIVTKWFSALEVRLGLFGKKYHEKDNKLNFLFNNSMIQCFVYSYDSVLISFHPHTFYLYLLFNCENIGQGCDKIKYQLIIAFVLQHCKYLLHCVVNRFRLFHCISCPTWLLVSSSSMSYNHGCKSY